MFGAFFALPFMLSDMRAQFSPLAIAASIAYGVIIITAFFSPFLRLPEHHGLIAAAIVSSPFRYTFNSSGILYEASSMNESSSPYWWLDSGAKFILTGDFGETVQGSLLVGDPWRDAYRASNPVDTDGGAHPQNIFRLVSRSTWNSVRLEANFLITKDNLSTSSNRNQSNGLLLMSRYQSGQTLYYAGIRVDGTAVIKKKYSGTYYTLAQKQIFAGTYSRDSSPNILPHGHWIRLRSDTTTNSDGSVTIILSMQNPADAGSWTQLLSARDDGVKFAATPPITGSQYVGIRTDFMDVQFDSFLAENI